jgi:hypothetical protein
MDPWADVDVSVGIEGEIDPSKPELLNAPVKALPSIVTGLSVVGGS